MLFFSSGLIAVVYRCLVEILPSATDPHLWVCSEPGNSDCKHVPLSLDGVVVFSLKMGNCAKSYIVSEFE